MRPVTLTIEGLRSFRGVQEIDFTGRDHIAIIGDTGAGKSSILEAVTFALYGRTTFSGKGNQELMNSSSQQLRVVLAFDVGDDHWQVSRALKRKRDGGVGAAVVDLRRVDHHGEDGQPIEAYSSVRDVNEKIVEVLGLDDDAFLRTVVLPQGQFARLLVDDDQGIRTGVLRQIWRTDELEAAGRMAAEVATDAGQLVSHVEGFLVGEPDDPAAHLATLQAASASAAAAATEANARHGLVERGVGVLAEAAETIELAGKVVATLGPWDRGVTRAAAEVLGVGAEGIEAERSLALAAEHRARAALDAVPADADGFDLVAVLAHDATLASIPDLLLGLAVAGRAADVAADEAAVADKIFADAAAELRAAEQAFGLAEERRVELTGALDVAAGRVGDQRRLLDTTRSAGAEVAAVERELAAAAEAIAMAEQAVALAGPELAAAGAALDDAESAVVEAQRMAAAAVVAHGLHADDECPVCERPLPAGWSPPTAPELDAARERRSAAKAAYDELDAQTKRAEAKVLAAVESRGSILARLEQRQGILAAAVDDLQGALESVVVVDLASADDVLLAGAIDAQQEAAAAIAVHELDTKALQERNLAARTAEGTARAGRDDAARRAADESARCTGARSALETAIGRLPADLAPALDEGSAIEAAVAATRSGLAERRRALEERADLRRELRQHLDDAGKARAELDERRRDEVDRPAAELWAVLAEHARLTERAEGRLHLDSALDGFPATCPAVAELPAIIDRVAGATATVLAAVQAAATAAAAEREAASTDLAAAALALGRSADDPGLMAVARDAADDARVAAQRTADDVNAFADRAQSVAALVEALQHLHAAHLAVDDLAVALKDGAFPKWLTLRRSKRLLMHASRLLGEMTGGRYAFADLADDSSPWAIFDNDSGQPRSPASLSGGEKFVASLALALGMVEMVGRVGGTVESMFLDEGFGALDRANLDAAVDALAAVAATGRMVAVISHVRAVAEQVEHVLSVTREPGGSRVRWLDQRERSALVDDDLEADPAIAGLLE